MAIGAPAVTIEDLGPEHWPEVGRIYADGIATGDATFETEVPSWERWDRSHLAEHRFVAHLDGTVVGWVALSSVSDRLSTAASSRTASTWTKPLEVVV